MNIEEALKIVLELASQNALSEEDCDGDEALQEEAAKQDEAIDCVEKWMRHAF